MSLVDSLLLSVFGMAVVFVVLIGLNLLIRLQSVLIDKFSHRKPAAVAVEEAPAEALPPTEPEPEPISEVALTDDNGDVVVSPGPGTVLDVIAVVGAAVKRGDLLLLLDAMDMEYEVDAPKDGTVTRVLTSKGAFVGIGTPLVEIQ